MIALAFPLLLAFGTLIYILVGVVGFIFLERRLSALVQHRSGYPFSLGALISTFAEKKKKVLSKSDASSAMHAVFYFWLALPAVFLFMLFGSSVVGPEVASLPALFLVASSSLVLEVIFVHYCSDALEREGWRSRLTFRFAGLFGLAVSFWVIALISGDLSLSSISAWQNNQLLPLFLSSPGAFLSSIIAFIVISTLMRFDVQEQDKANHLRGRWQSQISLNKRAWFVGYLSLWVFCFFGGGSGFLASIFFPFKVLGLALLFIWLQVSLPAIRSTDLTESLFGLFLKATMLGILVEIAWIGFLL